MVLYAVVDVETTGSRPGKASMTEIAIVVTDGQRILQKWSSLLKTAEQIPPDIVRLTGITHDMVAQAPEFGTVADQVYQMLKDKVFVAHHVEFDYGFVKEAFKGQGVDWRAERVCTSRIFRRLYGDRHSSLAHICSVLGVRNERPHRALPDALATAQIFIKMMADLAKKLGRPPVVRDFRSFCDNASDQTPPEATGIYYLINEAGRVEYVGKAKNIARRVKQHLRDAEKAKIAHRIRWTLTHSEWLALLLEDAEIQRLWPRLNYAQRKLPVRYGLLPYSDGRGNVRLTIGRLQKHQEALAEFFSYTEAREFLLTKVQQYQLNAALCGASASRQTVKDDLHNSRCKALLDELTTLRVKAKNLTGWLKLSDTPKDCNAYLALHNGQPVGYALSNSFKPNISDLQTFKPGFKTPYYLKWIFSQSDETLFIQDEQLAHVLESLYLPDTGGHVVWSL